MDVQFQAQAHLPTEFGDFTIHVFQDEFEHMAVVAGTLVDGCLVRIHSECATGDILGSLRCDCRNQLALSLRTIAAAGCGVVIYLRGHEGRGIGLANKIKAYALQEQGIDTVNANLALGFAADSRDFGAAVAILRHFGIEAVRLMTNNQAKCDALRAAGIKVNERVSMWTAENPHNMVYLQSKRDQMGHLL